MGFTRARRKAKAWGSGDVGVTHTMRLSPQLPHEDAHTRYEPQTFERGAVARDPYALWLAQQESARERSEGEAIRWVYRYPRVTRPAATTVAMSGVEATSPGGHLA
jgi:hypothetical protein